LGLLPSSRNFIARPGAVARLSSDARDFELLHSRPNVESSLLSPGNNRAQSKMPLHAIRRAAIDFSDGGPNILHSLKLMKSQIHEVFIDIFELSEHK
jgi:hypothetical protein